MFSFERSFLIFAVVVKVQDLREESDALLEESRMMTAARRENEAAKVAREEAEATAERARQENESLREKLQKQETMYAELKKMRGVGEGIDVMQELQQVSVLSSLSYAKNSMKLTMQLYRS